MSATPAPATEIVSRSGITANDLALAISAVEEARELARGNANPQLVISGLIRDDISGGNAGIPELKDLPGIGPLFGSQQKQKKSWNKKKQILLFRMLTINLQNLLRLEKLKKKKL